jgi:hypothetical protein
MYGPAYMAQNKDNSIIGRMKKAANGSMNRANSPPGIDHGMLMLNAGCPSKTGNIA